MLALSRVGAADSLRSQKKSQPLSLLMLESSAAYAGDTGGLIASRGVAPELEPARVFGLTAWKVSGPVEFENIWPKSCSVMMVTGRARKWHSCHRPQHLQSADEGPPAQIGLGDPAAACCRPLGNRQWPV